MTILDRLIKNLAKLPGIGHKSASRIAYYILNSNETYAATLSQDIKELKSVIKNCSICGNYTDIDPCNICSDPGRTKNIICIIEEPKDIIAIESLHEFNGIYHVLMGAISPMNGIGPENLTIGKLLNRIDSTTIDELIIATNPTVEGDTTALYLVNLLKPKQIKMTRLALGLPVGGDLEYTDRLTIAKAFKGRTQL